MKTTAELIAIAEHADRTMTPGEWIVDDVRRDESSFRNGYGELEGPGAHILSISNDYAPEGETNSREKWPMPVICADFKDGRFEEEPADLDGIVALRNNAVRVRTGRRRDGEAFRTARCVA